MLTYADWWASLRAVRALFADPDAPPFELVFLDNGSPPPVTGPGEAPHLSVEMASGGAGPRRSPFGRFRRAGISNTWGIPSAGPYLAFSNRSTHSR